MLKKIFLIMIFLLMISLSSSSPAISKNPIKLGSIAPDFTLPNQDGKEITLSKILKKHKGAVLAFYPKDDSKN